MKSKWLINDSKNFSNNLVTSNLVLTTTLRELVCFVAILNELFNSNRTKILANSMQEMVLLNISLLKNLLLQVSTSFKFLSLIIHRFNENFKHTLLNFTEPSRDDRLKNYYYHPYIHLCVFWIPYGIISHINLQTTGCIWQTNNLPCENWQLWAHYM